MVAARKRFLSRDRRERFTNMMHLRNLLLMLITAGFLFAQPASPSARQKDAPQQYSLPPDKLQKAIEYSTARNWLHFLSPLYGIAVLLATLKFGWGTKFRDWAEAASRRRVVQAILFVPLLILTI